jgi:excisionase family DNA binding protein
MTTTDNLFTTYTLAEYLQVSARTVQREVSRGRLTFVMVGGRRRYRHADVEYYLRSQLQRSRFKVIDGGRSRVARLG